MLRRRDFFQGRPLHGRTVRDIVWLQPDGSEMTDQAWGHDHARALAVFLSGDGLDEVDGRGRPVHDDSFLLMFNADQNGVDFLCPPDVCRTSGVLLIDTARELPRQGEPFPTAAPYTLAGRSLALVRFDREASP